MKKEKTYEVPSTGAMRVKAPRQIKTPKKGVVKTGEDLRTGK